MKVKATQKEIKSNFSTVLQIGYCELQWLLYYKTPIAYTAGKYGWNADVFDMGNGVAICTGYRPFGTAVSYDVLRKYDKTARTIVEDARYGLSTSYKDVAGLSEPDRKREAAQSVLDKMIADFIKEVTT